MGKSLKILVVDDEKNICRIVKKILGKNNLDVTPVYSAKDALEQMSSGKFSVLLSDIVMPQMDGMELLEKVKVKWPETKIVMMTAYTSTETAVKAIKLGAKDYISKPFTPTELRSTILRIVKEPGKNEIQEFESKQATPFKKSELKLVSEKPTPVETIKKESSFSQVDGYCALGDRVCKIFLKTAIICKKGSKIDQCPQVLAQKKKEAKKTVGFNQANIISPDFPFDVQEIEAATSSQYLQNMDSNGTALLSYNDLRDSISGMEEKYNVTGNRDKTGNIENSLIGIDVPFNYQETTIATSPEYAKYLDRDGFSYLSYEALKSNINQLSEDMENDVDPEVRRVQSEGLIGIDLPFQYQEVTSITGPEYVDNLSHDGLSFIPYEELKQNMNTRLMTEEDAVPEDSRKTDDYQVLVIDDEVAVNNNIRKILAKQNYKIDQAVNKEEALSKIHLGGYSLIFLDLKIPEVRGLELLEAIKQKDPNTEVIIVTGYASIENAIESARMGISDYLAKPFTPQELRTAAEKALKNVA